jgi:hypothetical protein
MSSARVDGIDLDVDGTDVDVDGIDVDVEGIVAQAKREIFSSLDSESAILAF